MLQTNPMGIPISTGLEKCYKWWKKISTKYLGTKQKMDDDDEIWTDPSTVKFTGPLLVDICNQHRLILNGVNIDIKLRANNDEF